MTRSIRFLAARPVFAASVIATLTLGFGVNTAVFSLTRTVLLRPLPYRDADRLVQINESNQTAGVAFAPVAPAAYEAWRTRADSFDTTAAFRRVSFNVTTRTGAVQVEGFRVDASFFPMLGISPAIGRGFSAAETAPGRDDVVLLSDGFWRRAFNGDPAIVGQVLSVDGSRCTVVGVLPATFKIFRILNRSLDVFRPFPIDPTEAEQSINVWAKLKDGVAPETARSQLSTIYSTLPRPTPGWTADVTLLSKRFASGPKPVIVALEWAVGLVLLIACANVANLLLAASAGRRKELAVRQALGATGWQIVRDLSGEPLILTAAGGALAILFAMWVVGILNATVSFQDVNRIEPFQVDRWVVAFTGALALLTIGVFALLPARTSTDILDALKDSTHGVTTGVSSRRLRHTLISAEVALALVLTISALSLARTAITLHDRPRGVSGDRVMTAQVALNDPSYVNPARFVTTMRAIVDNVRRSPAVETAALVNYPPLAAIRVGVPVMVEGSTLPPANAAPVARYFVSSPNYFRTIGIPIVAGRDFTESDDAEHAGVAIVSETFAQRFWNTTNVIGRRVRPNFGQSNAFWIPRSSGGVLTIVGVAGDIREDGLQDAAGLPQLYLPYAQNPTVVVTIIARAGANSAASAAPAIREAVRSVDSQLPVSYEMTFDEMLRETFARPRELAWLIGTFSALALALATIGVYGVMAFLTTARAREIAIRMALGATRSNVIELIVRDGLRLAAGGLLAGIVAAPLAFRALRAAVYGVEPVDPVVIAAVTFLLALFCGLASAIPAWRLVGEVRQTTKRLDLL